MLNRYVPLSTQKREATVQTVAYDAIVIAVMIRIIRVIYFRVNKNGRLYLSACTCVCVCVCVCVCMYVCMYVCMFACMHACLYVCMYTPYMDYILCCSLLCSNYYFLVVEVER